jgi:hypothetical protein
MHLNLQIHLCKFYEDYRYQRVDANGADVLGSSPTA